MLSNIHHQESIPGVNFHFDLSSFFLPPPSGDVTIPVGLASNDINASAVNMFSTAPSDFKYALCRPILHMTHLISSVSTTGTHT
jgi:hypothetical protein